MNQIAEIKQRARAVWAAGDFDAVAKLILEVGEDIVKRTGVGSDDEVLDVACGTGNASVPAARTGARVTGSDLTPELFESARANASEAGVEIDWVEADAEALPFEDDSYDVVLSTFGCMFAPRHEVAAAEIARVLRPGGRIGICSWTPEGRIGDFFRTIAGHVPPPPDVPSPLMWGTEDHVRGLFEGTGVEPEFDRREVDFRFDSAAGATEFYATKFGPVVMARQALEPEGRWDALREDLTDLFEQKAASDGGGIAYASEYLVVTGRKAG
jgi:SAM-dependent methyltransferase